MRTLLLLLSFSISIIILPQLAHAEDILYVGGGTALCSKVVADYEKEPRVGIIYVTWAQGYMSGLNRVLDQYMAGPRSVARTAQDEDRMKMYVDYCRKHPDSRFIQAVDQVFGSLPPANQ